jgi:hypothetical protein
VNSETSERGSFPESRPDGNKRRRAKQQEAAQLRTTRAAQVTNRDTQRVRLIRERWNPAAHLPCERCDGHTQTLTPEEAARFARTDLPTIVSLAELGTLHRTETAEGQPLICLNSLLRHQLAADAAAAPLTPGD